MRLRSLEVQGYRSIRALRLEVQAVQVVVGPNGAGKTNLYRALQLLAHAAAGTLARALAQEGGAPSMLWAGGRKKGPVRLRVAVDLEVLAYELELGITPPVDCSRFNLDPEVKAETIDAPAARGRVTLLERKAASAWSRDADGARVVFPFALWSGESVLAQISEPHRYPVASTLRQSLLGWRFYHAFRTDPQAAARHPQVGVRTPVLSANGHDLAAALATIEEIGDEEALHDAVERAFPGARLLIESPQPGVFVLAMRTPGMQRPLRAPELSDGTLRYLYLLAALLSPRPAPFLALNEPETSLHPDLLEPLAELVARASRSSQLIITTHSTTFAAALRARTGCQPAVLSKVGGETKVE